MHHFTSASDVRPTPAFSTEASGYRRFSLSDRDCGAVHTGWGLTELDANGHVNQHLQSFEKSFFVLEGNPVLVLDNRSFRLAPTACGLIPIGMKQAWLGPEKDTAKWIDINAPVPKGVNFADATYFLEPPLSIPIEELDIRDPTSRHLFRMADDDKYLMKPGDFLWAGVGCTHAFFNKSSATVRWLETQSPQPPARHAFRFANDWEYFAEQSKNNRATAASAHEKNA